MKLPLEVRDITMAGYDQMKEDLDILEIDENQELANKYVTAKYKKLAKIKHPDRDRGDTEEFQVLSNAYKRIIKYLEENPRA